MSNSKKRNREQTGDDQDVGSRIGAHQSDSITCAGVIECGSNGQTNTRNNEPTSTGSLLKVVVENLTNDLDSNNTVTRDIAAEALQTISQSSTLTSTLSEAEASRESGGRQGKSELPLTSGAEASRESGGRQGKPEVIVVADEKDVKALNQALKVQPMTRRPNSDAKADKQPSVDNGRNTGVVRGGSQDSREVIQLPNNDNDVRWKKSKKTSHSNGRSSSVHQSGLSDGRPTKQSSSPQQVVCHRCGGLGHKKRDCNQNKNKIKKSFKHHPKMQQFVDQNDRIAALEDAIKDKQQEVEDAVNDAPEQRVCVGVDVLPSQVKLADKIDDFANRKLILERSNQAYLDLQKRNVVGKTFHIETGTLRSGSHHLCMDHEYVSNLRRRDNVKILLLIFCTSVISQFCGHPYIGILSIGLIPLFFVVIYISIYLFNRILNLRFGEIRVSKSYSMGQSIPSHNDDTDQRPMANGMVDILRDDPLLTLVTINESFDRKIPRYGVIKLLLYSIFPYFQSHFNKDGCQCELRRLVCRCDDLFTIEFVNSGANPAPITISLELLVEILSANLAVRGKTILELRSALMSTAQRVHHVNLSRFENLTALRSQTIEFASIIMLSQERLISFSFPIPENPATDAGRFSG